MGSSAQPESKTKGNAVEGMLAKQEFEEAVELSPVQVVEQSTAHTNYFSKVLAVDLKSCWDRRNTEKEYYRTALPNVLRHSCSCEGKYKTGLKFQ